MQHGDLKSLLWGKHLSRMLGVCGVRHLPSDPTPRIVHPVPSWYQRLAGVLTIAGLVATVHLVNSALRYSAVPSPWWDGTQAAAFDTTAWTRWTSANTPGGRADLRTEELTTPASTIRAAASRWTPPGRQTSPAARRRANSLLGEGQRFQSIDVTAYTSSASETDSSPARPRRTRLRSSGLSP